MLVALSWGFCAYFPVGLMYLNLVLMVAALTLAAGFSTRVRSAARSPVAIPLGLMVAWTLLVIVLGPWLPDTGTRLFHVVRVALVLWLGLMLTVSEARVALVGFLFGSLVAAFIVAVHHVWGLPEWTIWSSLLSLKNNFSSGNMITMAVASSVFFWLGLRQRVAHDERALMLVAATVLGLTVALHAESRNSQLLLSVLWFTAIVVRFRSPRAVAFGLVAIACAVMLAWRLSPSIQARFGDISQNIALAQNKGNYVTSVGVRLRMYQEAAQGMLEHPVTGTGVGSWLPRWREVWSGLHQNLSPEMNFRFAEINNPHNDFLLAGMETGVPGMLILFWLFWRFLHPAWLEQTMRGGVTVLFGVAMVLTAAVNAPLRDAALGMTLLWLMAVSVAWQGHRPAQGATRHA